MGKTKSHILIVEDDPAIRSGLSDVLVFNGYSVTAVEDGRDGLELLLNSHFDLVLLDVMLPSMDGFTICRESRLEKPNQPIIMIILCPQIPSTTPIPCTTPISPRASPSTQSARS